MEILISSVRSLFEETFYERCLSLLPAWRRQKAERYRSQQDRARCVGAYLLLLQGLDRALNETQTPFAEEPIPAVQMINLEKLDMNRLSAFDAELDFGEYGKPFLKHYPDVCFSLSHSGELTACALADRPCGIDIERIAGENERIARRFFSPEEQAYLASHGDGANDFYKIWTMKEAALKASGRGISYPLRDINVLSADGVEIDGQCFRVSSLSIPDGYACAISCSSCDGQISGARSVCQPR